TACAREMAAMPRKAAARRTAGARPFASLRRLRDEPHPVYPAALESVFGPGSSVILRDVKRLLVHARVDSTGGGRIERDAPNFRAGKPGVADLPCLTEIVGDGDTDSPSG